MGLTVACVLRSGGHYGPDDVANLRNGVARHLKAPYRFLCLSDVDVPCERIPLEHNWPGWWSKIELFRLDGPGLYFDLDTVICGDLADLAAQAEQWEFTLLRDFYREKGLATGVMAWNIPIRRLYDEFRKDPAVWMQRCGSAGDQCFVEQHVNKAGVASWQSALPGQVVSYKVHVRKPVLPRHEFGNGAIPPGARVICFHGLPRMSELEPGDPVLEHVA
jgi:hypothetical protein